MQVENDLLRGRTLQRTTNTSSSFDFHLEHTSHTAPKEVVERESKKHKARRSQQLELAVCE